MGEITDDPYWIGKSVSRNIAIIMLIKNNKLKIWIIYGIKKSGPSIFFQLPAATVRAFKFFFFFLFRTYKMAGGVVVGPRSESKKG